MDRKRVEVVVSEDFAKVWTKLSREWRISMEQSLAPLTEGQLNVLELLLESDPMKPSDLIQHLSTTPAAVTTLLDRMERNELVVRTRDDQDRRIVWIKVSEKGAAEAERGKAIRHSLIEQSLDQISEYNQKLLVLLLGKVANQ